MEKIVVNKQRMLSHKLNSGMSVLSPDGCRCIKGAFLDALVNKPELPESIVYWGRTVVRADCQKGTFEYMAFTPGFHNRDSHSPFPKELTDLLTRYELRLFNTSPDERQGLLQDCVDTLEAWGLVEWEKEPCLV